MARNGRWLPRRSPIPAPCCASLILHMVGDVPVEAVGREMAPLGGVRAGLGWSGCRGGGQGVAGWWSWCSR